MSADIPPKISGVLLDNHKKLGIELSIADCGIKTRDEADLHIKGFRLGFDAAIDALIAHGFINIHRENSK